MRALRGAFPSAHSTSERNRLLLFPQNAGAVRGRALRGEGSNLKGFRHRHRRRARLARHGGLPQGERRALCRHARKGKGIGGEALRPYGAHQPEPHAELRRGRGNFGTRLAGDFLAELRFAAGVSRQRDSFRQTVGRLKSLSPPEDSLYSVSADGPTTAVMPIWTAPAAIRKAHGWHFAASR